MKLRLIVIASLFLAADILAAPDDRFKGASFDGYSSQPATDLAIPRTAATVLIVI